MTHHAVTAFGVDRPGIVAALTASLFEAGANLEDVSSTILRGHFSMVLVVDTSEEADALQERLGTAMRPLDVVVTVREVRTGSEAAARASHSLSVYGYDRPGIVAGFSRLLAERGVNITDLSCRQVGDEGGAIYAMLAELAVPPDLDKEALATELGALGHALSVEVTFQAVEPEVL